MYLPASSIPSLGATPWVEEGVFVTVVFYRRRVLSTSSDYLSSTQVTDSRHRDDGRAMDPSEFLSMQSRVTHSNSVHSFSGVGLECRIATLVVMILFGSRTDSNTAIGFLVPLVARRGAHLVGYLPVLENH